MPTPFRLKMRIWSWCRTDEASLTTLLLLFSLFATGLPRVFTSTATHTVLIDRYGAHAMPWAYVLEALLVPLAGYLFVRIENKVSLRTLVMGTLCLDLVMLALLWLSYQVPTLSWVAFAGIVWFEVEFALVSLMLWCMAGQYLNLAQGKRLFGIVGSGEPIAVLIGGFATAPLLKWLNPADLLLMSGFGVLVGLGLASILTRRFTAQKDAEAESGSVGETAGNAGFQRSSYVRVLMAAVFFSQLCYFFTDSAFYEQAHHRFPNENDLAIFLGTTSAAIGGISLFTGLFVSAPLMRRFGVRAGLLALPSLLFVGALLVVFFGHLSDNEELLFWLVVGNKLIDQALRYTLDKTSTVMLLLPIAADRRTGIQARMESMVEPLAGGVAGLLLLALARLTGFTAFSITHAILVAVAVWLTLVFVEHKGYLVALRQALARRRFALSEVNPVDESAAAILHQGLSSTSAHQVLFCLKALAGHGALATDGVASALVHAHPEVRRTALVHIATFGLREHAAAVATLLARESAPAVIGKALAAYAATQPRDTANAIALHLAAPHPEQRLGAFSALIRHSGRDGIVIARESLLALFNSSAPEERIFAAAVVENTAHLYFRRHIIALLQDPSRDVRVAALRAAAILAHASIWPSVLANLSMPGCEAPAVAALARGGEAALIAIDHFLSEHAPCHAVRRLAIEATGAIGGPAALMRLEALIGYPERTLHRAVLKQINRCGGHCPPERLARHYRILEEEIAALAWLAGSHRDLLALAGDPVLGLLCSSLATEFDERLEGMLHLIGFLSPTGGLDHAAQIFRFGNDAERAYLAEAIESQVPRKLRPLIAALLHEQASADHARFLALCAAPSQPSAVRLAELCCAPAARSTPWLRSCAIYAVRHLGLALPAGLVELAAADRPPLVAETLAWACGLTPLQAKILPC